MAAKPPPGLSMMEEIKWKQQQKAAAAAGGGGGAAAAGGPKPPAPAGNAAGKPPPPPGKKGDSPAAVTSPPKPGAPKPASDDKGEAKPKVSNSLASRQAMLANIIGGNGGGGGAAASPKKEAPAPKKDGPPPAKKWGKVDTDGAGSETKMGAAAVKLEKPTDLSKYEKMAKMLPQGAVENAMVRDGFDPGYLFENCVTMKSDKKPIKSESSSAPAAPEAPPAVAPLSIPAAAPPAPSMPAQAPTAAPQPATPPGLQMPSPAQFYQPPVGGYAQPQQMYGGQMAYPQGGSGWTQVWSAEHGCYYYTNPYTGESSWSPPANFQPQPSMPPPVMPQPVMQAQSRIVVMMYNFMPTGANSMEMPVYAQDQIEVHHIGADGWVQGRCLRTGQIGLVPQNYTTGW